MPGVVRALTGLAARFPRPAPEESLTIRGAALLAVLVAVLAVGVQEEFGPQAVLAGGAIIVGFIVSHVRRRSANWWLKAAIVTLILLVARDFFEALLANPFDPRIPLVRLFLWLQVLHSFDLPARKDLKYSLASAVVLIAVGAAYARAAAFGLLLVPFAAAAGTALVAMQAAEGSVPFPRLVGLGGRLSMGVVLAASLVFVLVPHGEGLRVRWMPVSARLWTARLHARVLNPAYPDLARTDPEQTPAVFNPQGYVGFSTYVDLRIRGVLDDTLVLRVRATHPGFWRGLAFDTYTGRGWRMTDRTVEEYASSEPRIVPGLSPDEPWPAGSEQNIQTFYVEANQPNVIFAAYRPFEVFFPTGAIGVDRYAGLRSPLQLEQGMIYSVISRVPSPTAKLLARDRGTAPASIRARYLQLPPLPSRVRHLAAQLTAEARSPYQKAAAIRRYLQQGFTYTLQAPLLPSGADAVDEFLFSSRQGSCEAFASTLAVLSRAAGVPARLVTGYATGSYNVFTGYYEVRNSDAHAWVEIFQPGAGWIEMEASPGFASVNDLPRRPTGQWLAWDAATRVVELAARALRSLPAILAGPVSAIVPVLLSVIVVGALQARARVGRTVRRSRRVTEVCYDLMLSALARRGFVRGPAVTPSEFAMSLPGAMRPAAERLTRVFEAFRYGHRPAEVHEEAASRMALADLRAVLRRSPRMWRDQGQVDPL
jgi:transglutaminase-like putative cysteine protease